MNTYAEDSFVHLHTSNGEILGSSRTFKWTVLENFLVVNMPEMRMAHEACLTWVQLGIGGWGTVFLSAPRATIGASMRAVPAAIIGFDPLLLSEGVPALANLTCRTVPGIAEGPPVSIQKLLEIRRLLISS